MCSAREASNHIERSRGVPASLSCSVTPVRKEPGTDQAVGLTGVPKFSSEEGKRSEDR